MSSPLEKERLSYLPPLPLHITDVHRLAVSKKGTKQSKSKEIASLFPHTHNQPSLQFVQSEKTSSPSPLRVGVLLSGGQAPGGHNVIAGLFDALKAWHRESRLFGFLGGPEGLLTDSFKEVTASLLASYRNTGGFDLLGSGRTKIEKPEDLQTALKTVEKHSLDGLVIIGGDDSNTNAAILAEFFLSNGSRIKVIGVPKTIDGDLRSEEIELSFGFDTATKIYSEMIGNICRDALSAKKYTHFIKLMGRSASHIALECALQTHPNLTLIGEEVDAKNRTLDEITKEITDLIEARALSGKNYGVILIPEGLIEFIHEIKALIKELNDLFGKGEKPDASKLSKDSYGVFNLLDERIQNQLLHERDPHGNIQVSQIPTEELLVSLVAKELKKRPHFKGKFTPLTHFLGYEGRAGFPSNFDATYTLGLGYVAALLLIHGYTGYIASIAHLASPPQEWEGLGIPITSLMHIEMRKGMPKPVIQKALVDIKGKPFALFHSQRKEWQTKDLYRFPGPLQFSGPPAITFSPPILLVEERARAYI